MSRDHFGNIQPHLDYEEHDGDLRAKKTSLVSAATIYAVVNTGAAGVQNSIVTVANTPLDVRNIGNVTVEQGDDPWNVAVKGNVTLSDSKGYIGLVTATAVQGGNWDVAVTRGNVTVEQGDNPWVSSIVGNVTLSDPKTFIGLVTVVQSSAARTITGNVTLSDSKGFIGLVTVGGIGTVTLADPKGFIGLVTVVQSSSSRSIVGNLTLSDSKGFVGLVTAVPAYGSGATVFTTVISATGFATILVAPASNRFFIKNLHVSSLGRAEIEFRSGATTLIPFTSLSTTGGFVAHYGEMGLPARAQTDALVANLNGGATVAIMANVRFEA